MFSLDLQARTLSLVFTEAIQVSSLSINQFSIQDRQLTPSQTFSFTSSSSTQSGDGTDISIDISNGDFNGISFLEPLGTSVEDTFLTVTSNGAQDFAGNNILPILSTFGLRVENHSLDRTSPVLTAASFDSNTGFLRLQFDETVSIDSFTPTVIRLQNSVASPSQSILLSGGVSTQPVSTVVLIGLSEADRNTIKSLTDLLINTSNSFISFPSSMVEDMHSNPVNPITSSSARVIAPVTADSTSPVIYSFDMDLDTGVLSLYFDETVDLSILSVSSLSLQSSGISSSGLFLSESISSSAGLLTEVLITLSLSELNLLKQGEICLTSLSCYLSASSSLLQDTSSNPLTPISILEGLLVSQFIPDTTQPVLLDFSVFSLDSGGLISLIFSETVRATSFRPESLLLQDRYSNSSTSLFVSSQSSLQTFTPDTVLNLTLSFYDLSRINLDTQLCASVTSCYLSIDSELVTDQSGNSINSVSTSSYQPTVFLYDVSPPILLEWDLSLESTGVAVFVFNEVVSEASFDSSQLAFLNPFDSNDTFSPSSGTFARSSDGFSISYYFTQSDLDGIQGYQQICDSFTGCYLAYSSSLITDVSSLPVVARSVGVDSLQVASYIADRRQPYLVSFPRFDLDSRSFNLLFSEPVDISTAVLTDITIIKHRYTYVYLTLSGGEIEWVYPSRKEVRVKLTPEDYRSILQWLELADDHFTTSVLFSAGMIQDMAQNPVVEITNVSVRAVSINGFFTDVTLASLIAFDIDLSYDTLTLEFDDVVKGESILPRGITLFSQPLPNSTRYQLIDSATNINPVILAPADATRDYYNYVSLEKTGLIGLAAPNDDYKLQFNLGKLDLTGIKILRDLATSATNTFIVTTDNVALDVFMQNVTPSVQFLQVRSFYPDNVGPNLVSFTLNLNTSIVKFSFNEPVNPASLIASNIIFQNALTSLIQYRLSNSTSTGGVLGRLEVEILLGYTDSNALKSISYLATNLSNTFIRFDTGAYLDQNENPNNPISNQYALPTSGYTGDTTRPYLVYFDLNLNDNFLSLYFDEAVIPSTLNISQITLQNNLNIDASTFTHILSLTSPVYTHNYDGIVFISLSDTDQIILKSVLTPYAKSVNDTYISFSKYTVRNYENLLVQPVSTYRAVQVRLLREDLTCYATQAAEYIPDTTSPILEGFEIDLNTGALGLFFNETMNHSSVYLPAITFLDAAVSPSQSYQLRYSGEVVSPRNSENLTVLLHQDDLTFVKDNIDLFASTGTSQLSFTDNFIQDMSDNFIDAVTAAIAIQARDYQSDTIGPLLLEFSLDMDSGLVNLTFNEPIDSLYFDPESITIQNAAFNTSQSFTLLGNEGSISVNSPSTILTFVIRSADLLILKSVTDLATSINDTFLAHTEFLIRDKSENTILATNESIAASLVLPDTTQPNLLSFAILNLNLDQFAIYFDEPMNTQTLVPESITIHASRGGALSVPLTGGYLVSSSNLDRDVTIGFNRDDIFSLKNNSNIATEPSNSFLSTTSQLIQDNSNIFVNAISPANALAYDLFVVIQDTTGPLATDCHLNLDSRTLSLTFNDPIDPSTLSLTRITLHRANDGTSPADSYTFQDTVLSSSPRGYTLDVAITENDFNGIKVKTFVAVNENTTHISMLSDAIQDLSNNPSVSILSSSAVTCSQYTPDAAPPYVTAWTLDMNASPTLTIDFSETVKLDSLQLDTEPITLVGLNGEYYRLTGGEFVKAPNSPRLRISFTIDDTNAIKSMLSLATYIGDTFLAVRTGALLDLDNNPLQAINVSSPQQANSFTPDTTNPRLVSFNLDMNTGRIWLTFDEIVNGSTLIPSKILLEHTTLPDPPLLYLTGGYFSYRFDTVVYLNLSISDLNELKRLEGLAVTNDTTYISIREGVIRDVLSDFSSNPVTEISDTTPIRVSLFIPDTTPPAFVRFSLNLTSETLSLTFDETVS